MSQPARTTTPRATSPRTTSPRTTTPRATARTSTARTSTARTSTARTSTARTSTARTTARTAPRPTGPVHVPRTAPTRRTGPVATGPQLRLVQTGRTTPARTPTRGRQTARRRAPFVVLLVGLLVATTLGLLLLNTAIAVDSLNATQQRATNAEQAEQVARLEQRVVAADTAAELARAATAAGLVPPGAAAHLVLQPDGTSVLLGNATPAPAPDPTIPDPSQPTTPGN
jgi:hypothetical protein